MTNGRQIDMPGRFTDVFATPDAADTAVARRVREAWPNARWTEWDGGPLPPADARLAVRAAREKRQLALHVGGPALRPVTREGRPSQTDFAVVHTWGCPCDCAYCFLQSEQTGWRPVLRADPDAVIEQVRRLAAGGQARVSPCGHACLSPAARTGDSLRRPQETPEAVPGPVRLHAGEVCDALAFDPLTGAAGGLVEAVRPFAGRVRLELRTKTDHVDGLLAAAPAENVVVSFTLCPPRQAARYDFRAASVDARIAAAVRCQRAGWRIGLRLDPIVAAAGWESEYDALLAELARRLDPAAVADASLGLLRFDADLGRIMRRRWPRLGAGTAEYARCPDSLSRPTRPVRSAVYRRLLGRLRAWLGEAVAVELCMESAAVRRDCGME